MSATKRLLFEKAPGDEPVRAARIEKLERLQSKLTVRIPTRRKNPLFGRRWDPLWPSCLRNAARALEINSVMINDGLFVGSDADAELVTRAAREEWEKRAMKLRPHRQEIEF